MANKGKKSIVISAEFMTPLTPELSGAKGVRLDEMLDTYGELCALASCEAASRALALR